MDSLAVYGTEPLVIKLSMFSTTHMRVFSTFWPGQESGCHLGQEQEGEGETGTRGRTPDSDRRDPGQATTFDAAARSTRVI